MNIKSNIKKEYKDKEYSENVFKKHEVNNEYFLEIFSAVFFINVSASISEAIKSSAVAKKLPSLSLSILKLITFSFMLLSTKPSLSTSRDLNTILEYS